MTASESHLKDLHILLHSSLPFQSFVTIGRYIHHNSNLELGVQPKESIVVPCRWCTLYSQHMRGFVGERSLCGDW